MGDTDPSHLTLAWLWIIENLTSFKQIDTSILHDLIEVAPEFPKDLGKNTMEAVALRCLGDLFSLGDGATNDDTSALDSKVGFDLSETCQDVLQHILQEISSQNLKMTGPDLLKWDINPFIMHKRASMPKPFFEQLQESIVDGTHPFAACLKEASGLECTKNEYGGIAVHDSSHNALAQEPVGSSTDTQTLAPEGNSIPVILKNRNGELGDDLTERNLSPSKRDRSGWVENQDGMDGCDDLHLNAKRLKQDVARVNQSVGEISVSLHENELVENPTEDIVRVTENEQRDLTRKPQVCGLGGSSRIENGHGQCVASNSLGPSHDVGNDEFQHNQLETANQESKMPENASGDGPHQDISEDYASVDEPKTANDQPLLRAQQKVSDDEAKGNNYHHNKLKSPKCVSPDAPCEKINADETRRGMEHFCDEERLGDSDGYHHESFDIATKKSNFLSSQCMQSKDSFNTCGWTEQNLCVKCNKDGQVLTCSTIGCPLVVHENCLGSTVRFDEMGDFYCPFCAYSLAISEYLEAKKKASMTRKELAAFLHKGLEHTEQLPRKEYNPRQNEEQEWSRADKNKEYTCEASEHQLLKGIGNKRQTGPSTSWVDLSCGEEEANVINGAACISTRELEGQGKMIGECPSVRELEGKCDRVPIDPQQGGDNQSCKNKVIVNLNQSQAEGRIQEEILQPQVICALNIDGEGNSSESEKHVISNYFIRFRRQERHCTYPAMPQSRRKKVPWTAKEEEMLKKGVRKFSGEDKRNIPWKKIMEFGGSVFLKGRTTMDLKDKWRNMCKGSPKPK